ncbi:MAG TPA: 2-oxoacid:acceptor oxidoreductase family protein [Acidimicrobiales bacterium]|nr:2-oxoacid:acceptor oxidoreductase family protein [Acidimicrobiales bacterium]
MFQVRFHGRGGQGVVTAAELLSLAAFIEGRHAQAIPSFGSERMGAPVVAFCRIADGPIRTREPVLDPDAVVVGDATLRQHVDLTAGLVDGGCVLVNTSRPLAELGLADGGRRATVPATDLARLHVGRPVPSAALLGGLAALSGAVALDAVVEALRQRFPGPVGEGNVRAAVEGHRLVALVAAGRGG